MKKETKDLKNLAKREATYSTLAKREAKATLKRLIEEKRKGLKESVKDDKWELKVDKQFAETRHKKAQEAKRKLASQQ